MTPKLSKNAVKTRFAPTPSGFLHKGNGLNLVLTWLHARKAGGRILLRIDDADRTRVRPEYIEDVFRSLEWLGLGYDDGPTGPDDFERDWSQRRRYPQYRDLLDRLAQNGRLYACDCSRKQVKARTGGDSAYDGFCHERGLPLDAGNAALRFANDPQAEGEDFVVWKKNGEPAYQLASLADDLAFGINLIVRGEDLRASTQIQLALARAVGEETFAQARFIHHALLLDADGQSKLSKSAGAASLKALRQSHRTPQALYLEYAQTLGLHECRSASELLVQFRG